MAAFLGSSLSVASSFTLPAHKSSSSPNTTATTTLLRFSSLVSARPYSIVELFLNHEDTQDNSRAYLTLQDFQSGLNDTLNTLFEINDHTFQETTILGQPYLEVNYDYPYDAYLNNMSF